VWQNLVTIAHMLREHINKADEVVHRTKLQAHGEGDQTLFVLPPQVPARSTRVSLRPVTYPNMSLHRIAEIIKTPEDFVRIRRFTSRSRCPQGVVPAWANLVKETLQRAANATSDAERNLAVKTFLLLPTVFLPVAAPRSRVESHIQRGCPFDITQRMQQNRDAAAAAASTTDAAPVKPPVPPEERLARAVTRLALDRKLRSAVKLMQQDSRQADSSFEEKVATLREKFIPRRADVTPLKAEPTLAFPRNIVYKVVSKMSRNAATCIDGWTRDLMMQAIIVDPSLADLLGQLCGYINDNVLMPEVMRLIRMGRLVAVPKSDGGVRPVVISSFLAKVTGSCVLQTAKVSCSKSQFAIGTCRGAERIVHLVRAAYNSGKSIIRIDSSNAFNVVPRAAIMEVMKNEHDSIIQYINTMYAHTSELIIYGPDGRFETVHSVEGVRQGDAASALLFCKVMDVACARLQQTFPDIDVWLKRSSVTLASRSTSTSQQLLQETQTLCVICKQMFGLNRKSTSYRRTFRSKCLAPSSTTLPTSS
jgi:hypothetical protein